MANNSRTAENVAMASAYLNDSSLPNPHAMASAMLALVNMVRAYDQNALNACGILANDPRTIDAARMVEMLRPHLGANL